MRLAVDLWTVTVILGAYLWIATGSCGAICKLAVFGTAFPIYEFFELWVMGHEDLSPEPERGREDPPPEP